MIGAIIWAIVVGAVIGGLARLLLPGRQNIGVVITILLGIGGSFLGAWVTGMFGYHNANGGFAVLPFLVGVGAAAILIAVYVGVTGRRDTTVRH